MSFNQAKFQPTGNSFVHNSTEDNINGPGNQNPFGMASNPNIQNSQVNSSPFAGSFQQTHYQHSFPSPALHTSTQTLFRDPFSNPPQSAPSFSDPFATSVHQSNASSSSFALRPASIVPGPSDPFAPRSHSYQNSADPSVAYRASFNRQPEHSLVHSEHPRTSHGDPFPQKPSSPVNFHQDSLSYKSHSIPQGSFGAQASSFVIGDPFASQQAFPAPHGQTGSFSSALDPLKATGSSRNEAAFPPFQSSRSSGMPTKGDPFTSSHSREAQPRRSQLFLRSVPPDFFDREVILNHFASSFPPLLVTNVSLRGNRHDKKSRRTAIISFASEADATKAMTLVDFQGEKLSFSFFRTATERVVDRAGEPSKELLFSYVPPELFSQDAIQNLFNSICPNGVVNVSTREKPTPNGVKRTAIIAFVNTESALTALKNLPSYNDTRLHVTFRQPPQHLSKKSVSMDTSSAGANDRVPDLSTSKPSTFSDPFLSSRPTSQSGSVGDVGMGSRSDDDDEIGPVDTTHDGEENESRIYDEVFMASKDGVHISKQKSFKNEEYAEKQREIEQLRRQIKEKEEESRKLKEQERSKARENNQRPPPTSRQPLDSLWRKNEKRNILDAVSLVGTCQTMCPEAEIKERTTQEEFSVFESTSGSLDPAKAVKKYRRSAALSEQPRPSDVRPPKVLLQTMEHLRRICDSDAEFVQIHHFVRDRTRSLRQDFTLQGIQDDSCIKIHEESVRFHILSEYLLFDLPTEQFSSKQNREQLDKCLISLREMYDLRRDNKLPTSSNEPEMQAYYVLTHMSEPKKCVQLLSGFAPEVRRSRALQFAFKVVRAASRSFGNGATYFSCVREAPYLTACLLHSRFTEIRVNAFMMMNSAYGMLQSLDSIALPTVTGRFGFESNEEALAFARLLKFKTNMDRSLEGADSISNIRIILPSMPQIQEDFLSETCAKWKLGRPEKLIGSKAIGLSPSEIIEAKGGVAWAKFSPDAFLVSPTDFLRTSKMLKQEVVQRLQLLKASSEPSNGGRLETTEHMPVLEDFESDGRVDAVGSSSEHKLRNLQGEEIISSKSEPFSNELDTSRTIAKAQENVFSSQNEHPQLVNDVSRVDKNLDSKDNAQGENNQFSEVKKDNNMVEPFLSWQPEATKVDSTKASCSQTPTSTPFFTATPGPSFSNKLPRSRERTKHVRFSLSSDPSPHPTFSHVQPQLNQAVVDGGRESSQPKKSTLKTNELFSNEINGSQPHEKRSGTPDTKNETEPISTTSTQQSFLSERTRANPKSAHLEPASCEILGAAKELDEVKEESANPADVVRTRSPDKTIDRSSISEVAPPLAVPKGIFVEQDAEASNKKLLQKDPPSEKVMKHKQENHSSSRQKVIDFASEVSKLVDSVEGTVAKMRSRKDMTESLYVVECKECLQSLLNLREIVCLAENGQQRAFKADCAKNWIGEEMTLTMRSLLVPSLRRASLLWDELTIYLVRSESQLRRVKLRLEKKDAEIPEQGTIVRSILVPIRDLEKPKLLLDMAVKLPISFRAGARSPPRQLNELTDVALQMFDNDVRCWQAGLINLSPKTKTAACWVQTRLCGWFNDCMSETLKFLEVDTFGTNRYICVVNSGNGSEYSIPETANVVIASIDMSCKQGEVQEVREKLTAVLISLKERATNVNNATPVVMLVVKEENSEPGSCFELGESFVSQTVSNGLASIVKVIHLKKSTALNFDRDDLFSDILLTSVKLVAKWELCKGLTLRETTALYELAKEGKKALKRMLTCIRSFDDVNTKNLETINAVNDTWTQVGIKMAAQACRWPAEVALTSEQSEVSLSILEKLRLPLPHQINASDTASYIERLRCDLGLEDMKIDYEDQYVHPFWQFCLALNSIMKPFIQHHLGCLSAQKLLLPLGIRSGDVIQDEQVEARFQTLDPCDVGVVRERSESRLLGRRSREERERTGSENEGGAIGQAEKRIRLHVPRLSWQSTASSDYSSEGGLGRRLTKEEEIMHPTLHLMFDQMVREEEMYGKVLERTFAELQAQAALAYSHRITR